jgi:hypothetical protein
MIKLWALVAKGHKNTNAPLIFENLGYNFFWFWANYIMAPSKYPLKWPIMLFARKKKIIFRIFKISGTLIVIIDELSGFAVVPEMVTHPPDGDRTRQSLKVYF